MASCGVDSSGTDPAPDTPDTLTSSQTTADLATTAPATASHKAATLLKGQQRFRGVVKAYCPIKGFGIIKCHGAQNGFSKDVFLDRTEAEKCELTVGATISFALKSNREGRPQACEINVLVQGVRMREFVSKLVGAEIDWNKTYVGTIKWFHKENSVPASLRKKDAGCGFITCEETHKMFERDVWVYPSKLEGFKIGDTVRFKVSIDHWWSYPTAHDVKKSEAAVLESRNRVFSQNAVAHERKQGNKIATNNDVLKSLREDRRTLIWDFAGSRSRDSCHEYRK